MSTKSISISEIRKCFAAVFKGAEAGDVIYLTRRGKPVAAVIPASLAAVAEGLNRDLTDTNQGRTISLGSIADAECAEGDEDVG